jgi:Stress responsive A/B Barrel Domain
MIRHMVHLRFEAGISAADKAALYAGLAALRGHLHGILDFQHRRNVSPEAPVVHGFADMFWFDFADTASRDAYLVDPDHQAMGARLVAAVGGLDGIMVCDIAP